MLESEYEYEHDGEPIRLAMHCGGETHEPRVHWQVGERSGERGYVQVDGQESVVQLEQGETARLQGNLISEFSVPSNIAEALDAEREQLGTVITESDWIDTDPTAFPPEIAGFERIGWEANRNVMWYWRDEHSAPRAYQIEDGELVFRAQEWADEISSKEALIDDYDLHRPC